MAVIKVGINGFGRIGRRVFRLLLQHPDIEVVAINDIADTKTLSHLLKYDSIHGVLQKKVAYTTDNIKVDQKTYPFYSQTSISKILFISMPPYMSCSLSINLKLRLFFLVDSVW